jgi:hypothetical protein
VAHSRTGIWHFWSGQRSVCHHWRWKDWEGKAQPGPPVAGESQLGSADEQHSLSNQPASLLAEHVSLEDPYALRHSEENR